MKKQKNSNSKRQYSKPHLSIHGCVEDITQGVSTGTPDSPVGGPGATLLN